MGNRQSKIGDGLTLPPRGEMLAAGSQVKPASGRGLARERYLSHINLVEKSAIIAMLRDHQAELEAAGVVHLRLHGSVARGDASDDSDVDLIADFDAAREYSLLDRVALENRLAEMLGARVDLSPATALKDPVRRKADREAVLAF